MAALEARSEPHFLQGLQRAVLAHLQQAPSGTGRTTTQEAKATRNLTGARFVSGALTAKDCRNRCLFFGRSLDALTVVRP